MKRKTHIRLAGCLLILLLCFSNIAAAFAADEGDKKAASESQTEALQPEAPQTEAQQTETPQTETPQTETLQTETSQAEAQQTETSQKEAPQVKMPQAKISRTDKKDMTSIIESVKMLNGDEDMFDKPANAFGGQTLRVKLNYDMTTGLTIEKGDTLSVKLRPADYNKNFLRMDYDTSTLRILEDHGIKVADLNLGSRDGAEFKFEDIAADFQADISMPFQVYQPALIEYFKAHPDEERVEFTYKLMYDGTDTGRVLTYTLDKPSQEPASQKFSKTSGTYRQDGELGEGGMFYNLVMSTKLRQNNEFVIYDTPDVNMGFELENLSFIAVPMNSGGIDNIIMRDGNHYAEPGDMADEDRMEIFIYDVYYLTEEASSPSSPRQAGYEEKKIMLPRKDTYTGADTLESMETVRVPKNILVEKPAGEALTAEEQALIDANGGLYKTVGKGFKIRVKNLKGNGTNPGGHLTVGYTLDIKNNSPQLNAAGYPVYRNTASQYGQEIPNCTPDDEVCTPIESEKSGNISTSAAVTPGSVGVDVDKYSAVDFLKVTEGADGGPDTSKPVEGAVFSIYKLADDNTREAAVNKDGLEMTNLVTNAEGKLCRSKEDKTPVSLRLERGNYIFAEESAPEGYEIVDQETMVSVGLLNNKVVVTNKVKESDPAVDIKITKMWENVGDNEELPVPEFVLFADGKEVKDAAPEKEGNVYTWKSLKKLNDDGNVIQYTVEEKPMEGFTAGKVSGSMEKGFFITNTKNKEKPGDDTKPDDSKPDSGKTDGGKSNSGYAAGQTVTSNVKTGDEANVLPYAVMLLGAFVGIIVLGNRIKRLKK